MQVDRKPADLWFLLISYIDFNLRFDTSEVALFV